MALVLTGAAQALGADVERAHVTAAAELFRLHVEDAVRLRLLSRGFHRAVDGH